MRRCMAACALPFCNALSPFSTHHSQAAHPPPRRTHRLLALRFVLLVLASWALRRGLAGLHAAELWSQFHAAYGWRHAALALGCTAASFVTLGLIEVLALRAAGLHSRIPRRAAMTTAFVTHAFSQSVGLALLTGAAVRLRAYARYRMDAAVVGRTSAVVTLTDGTFIEGRATRDMDRLAIRRDGATIVVDVDTLYQQDEKQAAWDAAVVTV